MDYWLLLYVDFSRVVYGNCVKNNDLSIIRAGLVVIHPVMGRTNPRCIRPSKRHTTLVRSTQISLQVMWSPKSNGRCICDVIMVRFLLEFVREQHQVVYPITFLECTISEQTPHQIWKEFIGRGQTDHVKVCVSASSSLTWDFLPS